MEQREDDWYKWRMAGLGSSDSPVIMGVSEYMTPHQLWLEKTGKVERDTSTNWAQARGTRLEPAARARYEIENDCEMPPTLAQHATYPFLRASLDGYNEKTKTVLEIKCFGKSKHDLARQGIIPESAKIQLQHQLLVTGADRVHYYSYSGSDGILVEYLPEPESIKKLLKALLAFWFLVETDQPPPLTNRDYVKIRDKNLSAEIKAWKKIKGKLDEYADKEKQMREAIIPQITHPIMLGSGVKIHKVVRKGAVDYSQIEALKEIDLEQFRKKSSESWRFDLCD